MFNDCDKKRLKKEFDISDLVLEETEKIIKAVEKNKICENEQPGKIVYAALYIAALQGYWRENTSWITQKEIHKKSGVSPAILEKVYKEIATKLDIEVIIPYGSSKQKSITVKPIFFPNQI